MDGTWLSSFLFTFKTQLKGQTIICEDAAELLDFERREMN